MQISLLAAALGHAAYGWHVSVYFTTFGPVCLAALLSGVTNDMVIYPFYLFILNILFAGFFDLFPGWPLFFNVFF
ncbi:hypothetical protein CSQ88_16280 [Iodobacter sp. BJB302]|nr:hypothetical protein CSQ88_16280 [Iodobacter sp. BJB302]